MPVRRILPALATMLAVGALATAQVDLETRTNATEILTVPEIEAALGVSNTFRIDGIAIGPEVAGAPTLFLVHLDTTATETFAQINLNTKTALFTRTVAQLKSDLGGVYAAETTFPILVGELVYDANRGTSGTLYFADSSTATTNEYAIIGIDVATGTASAVLRSGTIGGLSSKGVLSNGRLVVALGEDHEILTGGEPKVGWIDPTAGTPAFVEVADMDDFLALTTLAPTEELPPETIAVNPANDDVYVFCHDNYEIFRIQNFDGGSEIITRLNIPGWTGVVDLHGMSVDADGNLYGFDEAAEAIALYDGVSQAPVDAIELDDIATELGLTEFEPTLWRGIKAIKTSATTSRLYLSSSDADAGVVAIDFGGTAASVAGWELYR
ncbi:MAG: hypothetical protein KF858_12505 [Candidatus Sumerlaeia bacterium]|nr:hypothetical protein [Candidatus Sumerlaeia bacterium]